jgi:hypothetical protein
MGAVAAMLVFAAFAQAQSSLQIDMKDLPPDAVTYFQMLYPFARIQQITRTTENGTETYRIDSRDACRDLTMFFKSDGDVAQINQSMAPGDLPQMVEHGLQKAWPHARIRSAVKTIFWSTITYNVVVRDKEKVLHNLFFTFDGRIVNTPTQDIPGHPEIMS